MLKLGLGEAVTHASVGSFNNHWGVPLSLARMPADSGKRQGKEAPEKKGAVDKIAAGLAAMDQNRR